MMRAYAGQPVKFSDGSEKKAKAGDRIVIEERPGSIIGLIARVTPDGSTRQQRRAMARESVPYTVSFPGGSSIAVDPSAKIRGLA